MGKVKRGLKKLLEILGYRLVPKDYNYPNDLRDIIDDPISAKYYARKSSFLLNVPPEKCVIWWRFSCRKDDGNPFVNTITDYLENGHDTYKGSKMAEYYKSFQPRNVAELFSLDGPLSRELTTYPAYSRVLPWENSNMKKKKKFREEHIRRENKARGKDLSVDHGIQQFGPVSKEKGALELNSLIELTESIKENGYLRSGEIDDDITAAVLVHDDNYKYMIRGGTHRTAVLSALGYQRLPVRVEPSVIPAFVYRDEVEYWPKVRSGLYTTEQASQIFDLIFEGNGSEVFSIEGETY